MNTTELPIVNDKGKRNESETEGDTLEPETGGDTLEPETGDTFEPDRRRHPRTRQKETP